MAFDIDDEVDGAPLAGSHQFHIHLALGLLGKSSNPSELRANLSSREQLEESAAAHVVLIVKIPIGAVRMPTALLSSCGQDSKDRDGVGLSTRRVGPSITSRIPCLRAVHVTALLYFIG